MKRSAFITIHVGANFGSNLQTIATYDVLKQLGTEPICINYIPPRVTFRRLCKFSKCSLPQFVKEIIYRIYITPLFFTNKVVYEKYLKKHCRLTPAIYSHNNFAEKCPQADIYITGSDQSWNFFHNEGLDAHYFFSGIKGVKLSYATSIGKSKLSDFEISCFKKYLPEYKSLSVREKSAQQLLKDIGFDSQVLIDPTLMLRESEWMKYMSTKLFKEKYLLIYIPYNIVDVDVIYKTARIIADSQKLRIVTFSWTYRKEKKADKTFRFANPGDFLSLMYYADYVITNSFHGTAFSINFNKQFWVYMPSDFSTRISSIVEFCGCKDRILNSIIDKNKINELIDFSQANRFLSEEREKAIAYLKENI